LFAQNKNKIIKIVELTEQTLFKIYFWDLVKNYPIEEVSKLTGFQKRYIRQRMKMKKTKKEWGKQALFHYYRRCK